MPRRAMTSACRADAPGATVCAAVLAGHVRHFALEREIDRRVQQASGKTMQPMRTHPARSRAHLPRGRWPWDVAITRYTAATACSRRAAPRGKQDGFVAGTRAPRSGLPRVSVRVLASMRMGSPNRRYSCTLCCAALRRRGRALRHQDGASPGQATHATTSPQGTHYSRCTPRAPPRASRASNPPTPATTRPQRAARWRNRAPAGAPLHQHSVDASPDSLDAHSHHGYPPFAPTPGRVRELRHSPWSSSNALSEHRRRSESHRLGCATTVE